ncbi:MAG TPA: LysE family translocator [Vicinamibacteria bacterium]|jgi:threonine/homoserine/homoserine lactone efflux protein|nr:LysE family translocator [Vicinamibacteria bacterium]
MGSGQALLSFTAAAGLLTVTPGLDTALVLRTAAVEGPRRAMLAGAGICVGCLAWGLGASVGLGALLAASELAYDILRIVGASYLIFLGSKLLLRPRSSASGIGESEARPGVQSDAPARCWFVRGFFTNILNPKVGVFYATFLPLFIPAGVNVTAFSMFLASIHAAQGILWFAVLTSATRPLARWLGRPGVVATLDRTTGGVLVGFGLRLALEHHR